jgi:alkanesulfonate monooxygenase SsuD/methylene tetrahydromethanopterin reductase-like flavin-dependent oxidoreductase (luciferase family)
MDFGVAIFATDESIRPDAVARLAEERGHESLFFPEHTHIPVIHSRAGQGLARHYSHTYDLFVAATAAVAVTTRLRVGSGVCLLIQRDPIVCAKEVASVDHLSGGRFEFGVGAGWNRPEMANHGTDPRRRMAVLRERVEAMKAIEAYASAGFDRAVHWLPSAGRGPVERELDAWESAIMEFTGG